MTIRCIAIIDKEEVEDLLNAEFENSNVEIDDIRFKKETKELVVDFHKSY